MSGDQGGAVGSSEWWSSRCGGDSVAVAEVANSGEAIWPEAVRQMRRGRDSGGCRLGSGRRLGRCG